MRCDCRRHSELPPASHHPSCRARLTTFDATILAIAAIGLVAATLLAGALIAAWWT